jgi:hypothetical protein
MPTITLPGNPQRTLTVRDVDDDEKVALMRGYFKTSFSKRAEDSWEKRDTATESLTLGGVKCRLVYETADAEYEEKKAILKEALTQMEGHFTIPNLSLEVYCHVEQASIGYTVYRPNRNEPSMIIVLGRSILRPPGQILASRVKAYHY